MLKFAGTWGIYLAWASSIGLNIWLKKHRKERRLTNALNNGMITFNVISIVGAAVVMIVFFGALQNLLD